MLIKVPLVIAIDGYSSCGKSTLAKRMAKELGYVFVDTGSMYRAVTLYFIRNGVSLNDHHEIEQALQNIELHFKNLDGSNHIFLNEESVEDKIRTLEVSGLVSEVAALSPVRRKMVALQQAMAGHHGIVMDGRDIGTVVFPHADVKIFITADNTIRAQRRLEELKHNNQTANIDDVVNNLAHRDHIDTTRKDSPLRQADDAVLIDNSKLTLDELFDKAMTIVNNVNDKLILRRVKTRTLSD